jgi:hypothetical protein
VTTCGSLQNAAATATRTDGGQNTSMSSRLSQIISVVCPHMASPSFGTRQQNDVCKAAPFVIRPEQDYPGAAGGTNGLEAQDWLQHIFDTQNDVSRPMATMKTATSCTSSCDGTESSITACFSRCITDWQSSVRIPCAHTMLVGCSNDSSRALPRAERAGTHGQDGTWVVGDRGADALSRRPRKIFSATDGPYNCATHQLFGAGSGQGVRKSDNVSDRNQWLRKLCWGTLVPN